MLKVSGKIRAYNPPIFPETFNIFDIFNISQVFKHFLGTLL